MSTLESVVEVSQALAEELPRQPEWVRGVAADVEDAMRREAARFGKSLVGVPALVDTRDKPSTLRLPKSARTVELVFRCDTT